MIEYLEVEKWMIWKRRSNIPAVTLGYKQQESMYDSNDKKYDEIVDLYGLDLHRKKGQKVTDMKLVSLAQRNYTYTDTHTQTCV